VKLPACAKIEWKKFVIETERKKTSKGRRKGDEIVKKGLAESESLDLFLNLGNFSQRACDGGGRR